MNILKILYRLALADVLERTRRYSFLVTLGFTLYAAYIFVPPASASYVTLSLAGYRGIYNSAWIGSLVSMMSTTFLSLAGFYLVKNAIARDRSTGVGEILASTRVATLQYIGAKALSNFCVLAAMIAVLALAAVVMQQVRGEVHEVELWKLFSPFLLNALPAMSLVAVIPLLFESIKFLRGGLGNVLFFFLWIILISGDMVNVSDFFGTSTTLTAMKNGLHHAVPYYDLGNQQMNMGFSFKDDGTSWNLKTFNWEGIHWGFESIGGRFSIFGISIGVVLLSALVFDRFDSSRSSPSRAPRVRKGTGSWFRRRNDLTLDPMQVSAAVAPAPASVHLSTAISLADKSSFGRLLLAETRLMLKGVNRWWMIVALGLAIAAAASPLEVARQFIIPFAWVWPVLLWSKMGIRETQHRTHQLIFSAPHSLTRQLPAVWGSGVILALLLEGGLLVRLAIVGEWQVIAALLVGAMFPPSMALALGVWSGSGKLFEILYLLLWYGGLMNHVPFLDFVGSTDASIHQGAPLWFLLVSFSLLLAAFLGRKRQLGNM